jgi:hypothetical protein
MPSRRPHQPSTSAAASLLLLVWTILILATPAAAIRATPDASDPYRQVRVPWTVFEARPPQLEGMEVMKRQQGDFVELLARGAELDALRAAGIPFEVVIEDLEAAYEASRRGGGNFGIFHTYSETIQAIDDLHANFPSITTDKIQIGTTWEGRAIWAMKISDNPNVEESEEPEVLFDSVHHAREIMTVEVILAYMTYLCEGYGTDPEATELVDTRQIWFVPIVNPDGFVYNETTNPNGGGLWRKNRRNDLGACVGVDLNRNYPFEWGGAGASPDPCEETYRGPSAGSELETQAMIAFINQHEFVTHNSYHSVAASVIYPWGYTTTLSPDDATFAEIADEIAAESGYDNGTVWEILGYLASGGMFDWMYGETTTKPRAISFTTEVGGSGFWPQESERDGLVAENHYSNIFLTRAAGVYLGVVDYAIVGGDGNGRLDPGETVDLVLTLRNLGVAAAATNVTVTLASDDPYVALGSPSSDVGTIGAFAQGDNAGDPFSLTADASTPGGHAVDLLVTSSADGGVSTTETVSVVVGQAPVVYSEAFETGTGGWEPDP